MRKRQQGTVLIVAMLLVAAAAAAASATLEHQDYTVRRLETGRDYEQGLWVLKGGMHWARTVLAEDARSSTIDHGKELWAAGLPPTQIEQGTVAGEIADAQALFNLTNLARDGKPSGADVAALKRLLSMLGLPEELAEAIAARQPMSEVGDLQSVPGCDEKVIAGLAPFVTVLPRRTALNANTAPPEVLAAVIEGLPLADAQVLAKSRGAAPLRSKDDLRSRLPRPDLLAAQEIEVTSRFFLVRGRAQVGKADLRMEALLERGGSRLPAIVWERLL